MYTRPEGRRRVLITSGSRARMFQQTGWSWRGLVNELALAAAEVLIAAPEKVAAEVGAELGEVRTGWMPLDVVAPTCDLIVHHGGGATALTAMNAGVPQLIAPEGAYMEIIARAVSGFGAGLIVVPQWQGPDADPAGAIAAGCRRILSSASYAERARVLRGEIAALPAAAEMVHTLEQLAGHDRQ